MDFLNRYQMRMMWITEDIRLVQTILLLKKCLFESIETTTKMKKLSKPEKKFEKIFFIIYIKENSYIFIEEKQVIRALKELRRFNSEKLFINFPFISFKISNNNFGHIFIHFKFS